MAYSTIPTINPGDVVGSASYLNAVAQNIEWLRNARPLGQIDHVAGANITTTSTSYIDADATNLKMSITVTGAASRVLHICTLYLDNTVSMNTWMDIIMDSTTRSANGYSVATIQKASGGNAYTMFAYFSGVSAGTHDFKIQIKSNTAGTATISQNALVHWLAIEV